MKIKLLLLLLCGLGNWMAYSQSCSMVSITPLVETVLPRCNQDDGSIVVLNSSGGVAPYTYQLNGGGKTSFGAFFDLALGTYELIIEDGRNCKDTSYIDLVFTKLEDFVKPDNAFTPNGDGINDTWRIPGAGSFQQLNVRVFNRWGQEVHVNEPYDNTMGWDGTQNGSELTEGTYYYVISVSDPCNEDYMNGSVTIIR